MRLRNIPRADEVIAAHPIAIKEENNYKGKWHQVFQNDHPIHLEIGTGKGQFLLEMARINPQINYIGVERYSSVLLRALEKYDYVSEKNPLSNVRFLCMDAAFIEDVFAPGEVERIYLNFSDPWPKARHAKRRLTSRNFLAHYQLVLPKEGQIHFKTDNRSLFTFSLEEVDESNWRLLKSTFDLHHDPALMEGNVMTEYEEKFSSLGHPIHKLIASPPLSTL